jgi:oligopeptide transport system substrate-binding protein
MNDNLLQITPHPTRKELGFVVIFVSCYSFFLSVEAFLRKVRSIMKWILWIWVACLMVACNTHRSDEDHNRLRLNLYTEPPTLDSRKATDATSMNVLEMLFEGLTRMGPGDLPLPAAAKKIEISEDGRTYTFTLRDEAHWSNGAPITSEDFCYAWTTLLDPKFPGLFAYKMYVIQNAEAVKAGTLPMSALGVAAPDPKTLVVTLQYPTPYFLELTAFPTFYPIYKPSDLSNPDWAAEAGPQYISNGPFQLATWEHESEITVTKNPHYWDAAHVKLDGLHLFMIDDTTTELYMFEMNELDWSGSPLSNLSPEFIPALIEEGKAHFYPASASYYYKLNTLRFPLNNLNIRKALGYAINRKDIVTHITQAGQKPATALVPPMPGWTPQELFPDGNSQEAQNLFALGLKELGIKIQEFPPLTISYNSNREHQKIAQAIQHQWKEVLGLDVQLAHFDWKVYLSKISNQDYDIGRMGWVGDFNDPVSFLEPFKYRNSDKGGNNDTGWERPEYTAYLDAATQERNLYKRSEILKKAEALLIGDMPVIPLYFLMYGYLKKPYVHGVYLSSLGVVDFKNAYLEGKHDGLHH